MKFDGTAAQQLHTVLEHLFVSFHSERDELLKQFDAALDRFEETKARHKQV